MINDAHTYYLLDILRLALGVFFFIKGLQFISQSQIFMDLFKPLLEFGIVIRRGIKFGWRPNDSLWLAYTLGINRTTSDTSWRDLNKLYWSNKSQ